MVSDATRDYSSEHADSVRNKFNSDKVAEISYASELFICNFVTFSNRYCSYSRKGLSRPEVPELISHAGAPDFPTKG